MPVVAVKDLGKPAQPLDQGQDGPGKEGEAQRIVGIVAVPVAIQAGPGKKVVLLNGVHRHPGSPPVRLGQVGLPHPRQPRADDQWDLEV